MANLQQPQITAADTQLTEEELKAKLQQGFKNAIAQQEAQANAMRAMLAQQMIQEGQKGVLGNLDLRPFAQATKQYGATTAVVPTEAPEDGRNMMVKLQQALAEQQQGLGKQQLDYIKAQLEAKQQRGVLQALQSEENRKMRVFENVSRKFDKPVQEIADFYQAHDSFKSALQAGDIASIQSALSNYSRMTGEKGVLTDQDIARVITPTLSLKFAQLRSKLLSDPNTPVPTEIIAALGSGLDRLKQAAETKLKSRVDAAERQASAGPGLYKPYAQQVAEEARKSLRSGDTTEEAPMSFEEFKKRKAEGKL